MLRILVLVSFIVCSSSLELYDYGSSSGDTTLRKENDISAEFDLTEEFPYFNTLYNKAFVQDNGLVSFLAAIPEAAEKKPLPIEDAQKVLIAPFWANVDTTNGGNVYYRQIDGSNEQLDRATNEIRSCFVTALEFTATYALIVTWDQVSFFGHNSATEDPRNTFQLVLASNGIESYALFLYENIEWNAGTESGGDPEFGKGRQGATIGFNSGDLYKFFAHDRSSQDDDSQLQIEANENCPTLGAGAYVYKIDKEEVVESGCKENGDLSIFPHVGSMFGGEKIYLVGPCWDSAADIRCRFLYNNVEVQTVTGMVESDEIAVCVPDPFFLSGELKLEVSDDGGETYSFSQIYTVANLDRIKSNGVTRENSNDLGWSLAGYDLQVTWDASQFETNANITIEVLSYLEDGEGPRWESVYTIAENADNTGSYDFEGVAVQGVSEYNAFGSIRIHDANKPNGLKMWSNTHAFGYILNQEYQDNPKSWSTNKCDQWDQDETYLPPYIDELIPCPCTLEQAIADSGRFQPDTGCSMYSGSVCTYHQGAKHCVRSVAASETTFSGTQCCYQDNGDLMYAGDTDQGSTADRSHVWGAEPYQAIDMVPGLSHWKHDVITFYYCCIWGDDCRTYLTLRPTADCKMYDTPRSSATFGDPHFVTFDNLNYTFNGKGEFTMVKVTDSLYDFELQGRMEQAECFSCSGNGTGIPQRATSLTAIAMAEEGADTIHVELSELTTLRFVRRYSGTNEFVEFNDQFWLDFNGVSIIVVESDANKVSKATITYWDSGIGVNVTANDQMLSVVAILPPEMQDNMNVVGLLGNWDNSSANDLIDRNGGQLDPDTATPEEIRDFGLTWETPTPTLFYYESSTTHDDYQDNNFVPVYEAPDRSTLPSDVNNDIDRICGDNELCIFDMSLTRSTSVGELTMEAVNYNDLAEKYTQQVIACTYIPTPRNGSKNYQTEQENNLAGAHIIFECDEGTTLTGPEERICQTNGEWTGEGNDNDCVETGCPELESPKNGYIDVRFEDGVFIAETICDDGYSLEGSAKRTCNNGKWSGNRATCIGGLSSGAKAGIAIGVLLSVAIILVIVIFVVIYMYKDSGEQDLDQGKKVKGDATPGENWAMDAEVDDATAAKAEKEAAKESNGTHEDNNV